MPSHGRLATAAKVPWHSWGGIVWNFSAEAFADPFAPHPDGAADYIVIIRLRRNDEDSYEDPPSIDEIGFTGDSELILPGEGPARQFTYIGSQLNFSSVAGEFVTNGHGRIGAIRLVVSKASRMLDAYRIAQTMFNRMVMDVAVRHGIPLRRSAMLIVRLSTTRNEFAIVKYVGYPVVKDTVNFNHPLPLARLFANYAEAIASNSPFYAFLGFFVLVEILIGPLQGNLKRFSRVVPIQFENLAGTLTPEECRYLGHFMAGFDFRGILEDARKERNAVAHFLMEVSSRPLNVVAEDQIAFKRDMLKIATRRLLQIAERNVSKFISAGVTERTLTTVFEGRFEGMFALTSVLRQVQSLRSAPQRQHVPIFDVGANVHTK